MHLIDRESTVRGYSDTLRQKVHTSAEIVTVVVRVAEILFPAAMVSICLNDPSTGAGIDAYVGPDGWRLGVSDWKRLIKDGKERLLRSEPNASTRLVDRSKELFFDKVELKGDIEKFGPSSRDILVQYLVSDEELILGVVILRSWTGQPLTQLEDLEDRIGLFSKFSNDVSQSIDDLYIHQKIESLLVDKKEMKLRIQKDEEDLKRRILELTVLYDTSNSLGYSLDYYQIVRLVTDSLAKVLNFDICAVFLLDFHPGGEIVTRISQPTEPSFVNSVQSNVISAIVPFIRRPIDPTQVKLTTELTYQPTKGQAPSAEQMKSFANVPLIFKEEVIGMLNVCSTLRNAFPRNEMTFLHTMANQLSSHLGRLKVVKKLEKTKMDTVIKSMSEAVVMMDENGDVEFINPAAEMLLRGSVRGELSGDMVAVRFVELGFDPIYRQCLRTRKAYIDQEVSHHDRIFLVNATPVLDAENQRIGTVLVIRDITEIQRNNRIKTQRLDAIAQVNVIIKSISDLDNMLTVLMQFILNVVNAESGAIQLKSGKKMETKVHCNFPDKIRREYRFKSGETISEHVARNKEFCFIEDYHSDTRVQREVKVLIDSYVCIPIMVKNDLIGVVSIVRKYGNPTPRITQDDIRTLTTITLLSGTAIQNALLYQETLNRQRMDQELRIATEIQNKLLPTQVPEMDHFLFGAVSVSARGLGGDYYDFFKMKDGRVGICIADIVGKGISAGLYMAMLKSLLHSQLNDAMSPSGALQKLNELLYRDPVIDKFVPLFFGIFSPESMTFTYSNAGHEPPLLFSGDRRVVLDSTGLPLGALLETEYEDREVELKDDDILAMFTDGIVDARDSNNRCFGIDGVVDTVNRNQGLSAKDLSNELYLQCTQFMKDCPQQDDITIVIVKSNYGYLVAQQEQPIKTKKLRVTSSVKYIKKVRAEVEEIATEMGFSPEDVFNIKLAINEAHANVIEHAYSGSDSGDILFQFLTYEDRLEIGIKDFGQGMGAKTTKGDDQLEELEGSGLGVFLIKTVMDRVRYKRTLKVGTELWLTKFIPGKSQYP